MCKHVRGFFNCKFENTMKKRSILILLLLITACDTAPDSTDRDINLIEDMSADRAAAFNDGDASRIAAHFSDEGLLMAPDSETLIGRDAVEEYYQAIFDEFETALESYYEEVKVSGNLAYGRGIADVQLIQKTTGDTTYSRSKYLNILEKNDKGKWVTTHDIWNNVE